MDASRARRILIISLLFVAFSLHDKYKEEILIQSIFRDINSTKVSAQPARNSSLSLEALITPIHQNFQLPGNEPFVLLHVGPHKTGTTSMQKFLYKAMTTNQLFIDMDFIRIPTFDDMPGAFGAEGGYMLNLAHCCIRKWRKDGGQMNLAMCNRFRKHFKPFVAKSYNQSKNLVIIAEDFDRTTLDFERIRWYLKPYTRCVLGVYLNMEKKFES